MTRQLDLFQDWRPATRSQSLTLEMDRAALERWKTRIYTYQQSIRHSQPPQQQTLFSLPSYGNPDEIDPFTLRSHNSLFYRLREAPEPTDSSTQGFLYFVIDSATPLLLYVGETKLSATQRWQGVHDCKDYIFHYIELHRRYQLPVTVGTAFWPHLPPRKKILQQWELALIYRWRSPFNKESWQYWSQPFGKS